MPARRAEGWPWATRRPEIVSVARGSGLKEEGLQVRIHHSRTRAGVSSSPQIEADAPKVVWAMAFQFDSTIDRKVITIASMIDEHTQLSVLNVVERSITAQRLTEELDKAFALWGGSPLVLRMGNGPEFISAVLQQFCRDRIGISCIPPGTPWNNGREQGHKYAVYCPCTAGRANFRNAPRDIQEPWKRRQAGKKRSASRCPDRHELMK